jgi:hypothetical protein
MSGTMLVHDTRLEGVSPSQLAPNTFRVNDTNLIRNAMNWVAHYARSQGGLSRLLIMCHGFESAVSSSRLQATVPAEGFGLCLCLEGLTLRNVSEAHVLNGLIEEITLYACGPANTHQDAVNTAGDGRRFCGELAAHTNAYVIASDTTQVYSRSQTCNFFGLYCREEPLDFGEWEGQVYRFSPDGSQIMIR